MCYLSTRGGGGVINQLEGGGCYLSTRGGGVIYQLEGGVLSIN